MLIAAIHLISYFYRDLLWSERTERQTANKEDRSLMIACFETSVLISATL